MPDNDSNLPPGFVVQGTEPSSASGIPASGLPPGFVIQNPTPSAQTTPTSSAPSSLPPGFEVQSSPDNGQPAPEPTQHLYQDSSQPWYKRGWDFLNTPLTESLFGLPEDRPGAGGFERGVEHIVSGLTSPLSVALTAATLGTGGFIESAGASALREIGGMTAAEIADVAKGSQVAINAAKELPEGSTAIADAVRDAGVDPALWKRGQDILYNNGLSEHDLLQGNMVERGAYQILRKTVPDLPISVAARSAKTANTLLNAGFTLQQFESAAAMSPRFLDALKEGDTDKALEYGTEALAGAGLGILGTSHALHSAGELFKPLVESDAPRPSDEWNAINRANSEREAQHAEGEQKAIDLADKARYEILGHKKPGIFGLNKEVKARQDLELASVLNQVIYPDPEKAAFDSNVLLEAVGRSDEKTPVSPNNGLAPNPDVQALAQKYAASVGIDRDPHEGLVSVDPEAAKKIADAYEEMKHDPDDPKVKASYDALIRETKAQWDAAKAAGYKMEPWPEAGQPYGDAISPSKAMAEDVKNNKHLYYFQGREVPENHPLGQVDPETGETYNNIFRAVHDLFGHAKNGYEFGPRGEENAFLAHSKMYSDKAIPALLSETKGQNSWVNFGKHLRDENGNLPVKGEKGFVPPPERPFAEQKAGILPPEIVNPHLSKEPQVGTPIETPSRAGTQVVHSNDAGEVRVGADGRPVVWLSPAAWRAFNRISHPGFKISGVSYSPEEAAGIANSLLKVKGSGTSSNILDLFWKAQNLSKQNLLTAAKSGIGVDVVSEELHHTWQRELAQDGEIHNHLAPGQWSKLSDIIPSEWVDHLNSLGYPNDPVTRVAETAAQFMSHRFTGIISETDADRFLDAYYEEVVKRHGPNALESMGKINDVAEHHVGDINAERNRTDAASTNRVADQGTNSETLRSVAEGRETSSAEGDTREQTGLKAREDKEFQKLSGLKLRVGMGDPGSAGLVTGDNDVLVGRDHADLIREAGYKATPSTNKPTEDPYSKFFRDGGVRIRTAGGVAHVDFMEPNADTWDRVYRSIESMPEANRYYVDFRPIKGGTGFSIDAYDKDNLLFRLKNLEDGKERPSAPGSVSYFRQGLLSREGDYRDKEPRFPGLASRGSVTWDDIKPHLADDVTKHDTEEKQAALTAAFNALPDTADYREAIKAGRAGQLWYERSSRAFDALMDSGADFIKPKDKTKFLNFVAALSPVQPVRSNLLMALNLWSKWDKAGRPTDVEWKDGVPNKNASLYRILKGRGQTQGVDLPARMNNAVRALQGEPLSGPKVSAFTTNLGKDVNRVTNDTWMAVFGDQDPNRINKPAIYDAMSAKVREAAKAEGIAPRQAQAAVWSFIKSLAELSGWENDRWIPPQEIIKQGLLTPELVGMHSADFADMLQNDPEIREAIRKIGGDLNALDTKLKSYVPGKPSEGEAAVASPELLNAAGRLEAARSNSRIAGHLARKQEPGLFDTEFRPNNGLFSKEERENLAPTWYLKSNQLIDSRMGGPMPADTVLKMLENNGVKPDELKYTGLDEFLRSKGKEPVRPDELRQYLAANNLQVQEISKGGGLVFRNSFATEEELQRAIQGDDMLVAHDGGLRRGLAIQQSREGWNVYDSLDRGEGATKFGSYTLPGGQNYREMLLTLPKKEGVERPFEIKYDPDARANENWVILKNGMRQGYASSSADANAMADHLFGEGWRQKNPVQPENFQSGHWDEPNVVGHVRFNDRIGPNGEKLLHLEELQSDWHQKGRTQGYSEPTSPEYQNAKSLVEQKRSNVDYAENQAHPIFRDFDVNKNDLRREALRGTLDQKKWGLDDHEFSVLQALHKANEEWLAASEAEAKLRPKSGTVPDAPFKKTWPELLMKRMVRYAAEHGYDGVSWTPGEEQASRYDLSQQVDHLEYNPETQRLNAYKHDTSKAPEISEIVPPEKLPDVIGKDAAAKLMESEARHGEQLENGRYSKAGNKYLLNADLKIGGEGMKGFYDKIVPEAANKLGKQFGAKVGSTEIDAGSPGKQRGLFENNIKKVPYLPITGSMRESVLKQGQPLFSRSPDNGQPSDLDEQIRSNVFKNQPKEYQDLVLESLRRVASGELSDREQAAAKFLRDEQDKNFEIGSSNDLLHHYIEDYMTRVYKDTNPQGKVISSQAKSGRFATNVSMAKQRVYDSNLTALLKSPKQMSLDPVDITAKGRSMLIKAAANRQLIDTLRDKFTRASDGRPAVVLSGQGQVVSGENGEDPKTFIDPNRVRKINIDPKVVDQLSKSGDLQRYLDEGTIKDITPYVRPNNIGAAIDKLEEQSQRKEAQYDQVGNNKLRTDLMFLKSMQANGDYSGLKAFNDAQERAYAWDPQDYISLANGAMKGWNFITNSPDGTPIYVRSDIRVHPEFAEYLQNRLGLAPSELAKHPIGKALLGAGATAKKVLLSFSPFHLAQLALRSVMVGINPFNLEAPDIINGEKIDPSDPNSKTILKAGVEQGLTLGTDYKAMQDYSEGVSAGDWKALRKIPQIGDTLANSMDWFQNFLFKRTLPAYKAFGMEKMFHEYQRLHPEWSTDRVARAAAQHTNDTFGGIAWQQFGRSALTQDFFRVFALAPDWLESEVRSVARLFNKDEGGLARAQMIKMTLALWGTARVLNLLTTGNAHYESPFALSVRTKDGKDLQFGIRTLPSDALHMAADPIGFLKGRMSPIVRTGTELITGRDNFGRKLEPSDLWADVIRQALPIPAQDVGQALTNTGPEVGNPGQVWKAIGGTTTAYASPGEKLAAQLAANHNEDGPVDQVQMARHRTIMEFEDKIRSGQLSWPDVYKMYASGELHQDELKKIQENAKRTKDMDPALASMYTRASRLPGPEYLQLYDTLNSSEKAALVPLTLQVRKRYIAKAMKNMRPEERLKDPTFMRFLNMVTDQSPF